MRKFIRALAWAAAASCIAATVNAATARRPLQNADIYRILDVTDVQVSPDGAWVCYVVTGNDRDTDEPRSALWMSSWDGVQQVQLTNPGKSTRAPRWSPDGRYLAFLGQPAGTDKSQLFLIDRRGGEPRALTQTDDDIDSFVWSPDGGRLALVMEADAEPKTPKPIVIDALYFKKDIDGYISDGRKRHLYLLDVATRKLEALTSGADFNDDLPAFAPDGRRLAFVRTRERGNDPDGKGDIELIDATAGAQPAALLRDYATLTQHLAFSPDGHFLAYLRGVEPKYYSYAQETLQLVPVDGGTPRTLGDRLDRVVLNYEFLDTTTMLATIEDDGVAYPAQVDVASGTVQRLLAAPAVVAGLSTAAGHTALLLSDDRSTDEVYALEAGSVRRLSTQNDTLFAEIDLRPVEDIRFRSHDGTEVHGVLIKPSGFVAGRRYPTVLWIHGGPKGQDQHGFVVGDDQFMRQLFAAQGYLVLGVNYRGSTGRGSAFARAIAADWGHKEVQDLLAGVDYMISSGGADPGRLGIGGWSYGGILTDYTIASDRRFKAAVSGAGTANQLAMYGSDEYAMQWNAEIGYPWRSTALWLNLSYPFFHADRIHTPTLFLGGTKDFNVPLAGGEQMYQALRTLGVPTQLVVYPGEYHVFTRPSFVLDSNQRMLDWFAHRLGETP